LLPKISGHLGYEYLSQRLYLRLEKGDSMTLPRFIPITPPGNKALLRALKGAEMLNNLPLGLEIIAPHELSFEWNVVHTLASLNLRITTIEMMLIDADRPPWEREGLQGELTEYVNIKQSILAGLVEDQGGYLLWIWAFEDPNFTKGSRRFPQ
jgi:hypothetical protein